MTYPEYLKPGDKIAIISPGAPVKEEFVYGACDEMRRRGFQTQIMPHALSAPDGIYAASAADRAADFIAAWSDPGVKAILCARGGYGSIQLIPEISRFLVENRALPPKWLVGFSDITVFHNLLNSFDIVTIHGPMAKNIATTPNESIDLLFRMLTGVVREQVLTTRHPYNIPGTAEGSLWGGNFATLNGFEQPDKADSQILFMEDVGEQIYEINRMLWRLGLKGLLNRYAGIVVGSFTEYRPDRSYTIMEDMIRDTLARFNVSCPVIFGFPAGHIDNNHPLLMGARTTIKA